MIGTICYTAMKTSTGVSHLLFALWLKVKGILETEQAGLGNKDGPWGRNAYGKDRDVSGLSN